MKKILLLGSGELGKEFTIAAQRLGQHVIACDAYPSAPAMQVADEAEVFSMLDGEALERVVEKLNPDLIVLGGTLAVAKDYIMLPLKSAINKYSLQLVNKDTTIKLSKLGEKAGAVGACMLSRSKMLGLM